MVGPNGCSVHTGFGENGLAVDEALVTELRGHRVHDLTRRGLIFQAQFGAVKGAYKFEACGREDRPMDDAMPLSILTPPMEDGCQKQRCEVAPEKWSS